MTENIPPSTSSALNGAGANGAATTGSTDQNATSTTPRVPYYENLRRQLRETLQKKRLMDKSLAQLEDQIFRFEQSYLEETTAGNIIKGFDNYIKGSSSTVGGLSGSSSFGALGLSSGVGGGGGGGGGGVGTGGSSSRRRGQVSDLDRVFSRSSASFMRDSPAPSSAQTTPSHAPTPSSMYNNGPPTGGSTSNHHKSMNGDGPSSAAASIKGGSSSKNKKKGSSGGGGGNNRGKDKSANNFVANGTDDEEGGGGRGEKPPTKRLKITYGRD